MEYPSCTFFPHSFHVLLVSFAYVIEVGIPDDGSEERGVPYPVVGHHNDFGRKGQQHQDIDKRLMIGNDDCRTVESFVGLIDVFFLDGGSYQQDSLAGNLYQFANQMLLAALAHRYRIKHYDQQYGAGYIRKRKAGKAITVRINPITRIRR